LLLQSDACPTDIVIPVNEGNRYQHPDPQVVLECLKKLGKEHVHFSGFDGGVEIGPKGVERKPTALSYSELYDRLFQPMVSGKERELATIRDELMSKGFDRGKLHEAVAKDQELRAFAEIESIMKSRPPVALRPIIPPDW